jgi:hypothetical protein
MLGGTGSVRNVTSASIANRAAVSAAYSPGSAKKAPSCGDAGKSAIRRSGRSLSGVLLFVDLDRTRGNMALASLRAGQLAPAILA